MTTATAFQMPSRFLSIAILALCLSTTAMIAQVSQQWQARWIRYPEISPDGQTIVFSYNGDLYTVAVGGGLARVLTSHSAHDTEPHWSPDGRSIVFASDRFGNMDVFAVDSTSPSPRRLTSHSASEIPLAISPDGKNVIISSARIDDPTCVLFPAGLPETWFVPLAGGKTKMYLSLPMVEGSFDLRGRFYYTDQKGYENEWRKHHTSSVTRDIWRYDPASGRHAKLTGFAGEDRNPVVRRSDGALFYLSEQSGSFNVWKMDPDKPNSNVQVTTFDRHPVRFLSVATNGTLCFTYGGDVFLLESGQSQPRKLSISIPGIDKGADVLFKTLTDGASEYAISPNGKEAALVIRGEVFVVSLDYKLSRRITNTAEQERSVSFSPDGKKILYAAERGGSWNIYATRIASDETFFYKATVLQEDTLISTPRDEFQPRFSPDGEKLAYIENRTKLRVLELKSKRNVVVQDSIWSYSYRDGDQWYQWSPDSKWLATELIERSRWVGEVGLVDATGRNQPKNLTQSGYDDSAPKWSADGSTIYWFSDRAGMRSHGSWGAQSDVFAMFLTQAAFDKFKLSKDEFDLLNKDDDKTDRDEKKEDGDTTDAVSEKRGKKRNRPKPSANVVIDSLGLAERVVRLTINSSDLADAVLSPDGERLYYLARFEKGFDLWVTKFRDRETKLLAKLDLGGASLELSDDGKQVFALSGNNIVRIDTGSGRQTRISYSVEMELRPSKERDYIFEHAWRQTQQKFYLTDMHGVDWAFYREHYRQFLPHVGNNYDFAELLSEMLGELNASHTGGRYRPKTDPETTENTSSLAFFEDYSYTGKGVKIKALIDGSPLLKAGSMVKAGHILERVNGQEIGDELHPFLNRQAGKPIRLGFFDPASGKRWDYVTKPISRGEETELLYKRWVRRNRDFVDSVSGGKLGYVHVRSMDGASFRSVYSEALGKEFGKAGLIVDTRFNGGGWLHDDLATFLSGKQYVKLVPREQHIGSEPQNKWQAKSVVIVGEGNYSDAHFFPYAYRALNIGKIIGAPVPGTATAVWWENQIDPSIVFGIPQVGVVGSDGKYLENQELVPDIVVYNKPEDVLFGRDTQLIKAIEELSGR